VQNVQKKTRGEWDAGVENKITQNTQINLNKRKLGEPSVYLKPVEQTLYSATVPIKKSTPLPYRDLSLSLSTTPPPSGLSRTLHLFKLPSRKSKTSSCLKVKYVTVSFVKESYKKNRALFQKRLRFSESLRIVATALHWARPTRYLSLQHTATRCNTLQHTATHCNTLCKAITVPYKGPVYFAKKNDLTRIRTLCTPKRALHTLKRTLYTLKRALYKLKKSPLHK